MIDVKIISKPKNEGSTSAVNTGSTAYSSMAVKEAAHAAKADIAETAKEADHAAEADHALVAETVKGSIEKTKEADHAKEADNSRQWGGHEFSDWLDQPVRKSDAVTFASVTSDDMHSSDSDGSTSMTGKGWTLRNVSDETGSYSVLAVDNIVVRKKLEAAELEIHKKTYVGAQMIAGDWGHKILRVDPIYYDYTSGEARAIGLTLFTLPVTVDGVRRMVAFVGKSLTATETRVELLGDGKGLLNKELEQMSNAFKVYFCESDGTTSVEDDLVVGGMGQCQEFNVKERVTHNFTNTYYWGVCVKHGIEDNVLIGGHSIRCVYGVFAHTTAKITLKSEAPGHAGKTFTCYGMEQAGCTFPVAGDDMVGFGCADPWQDADRCNGIIIASKDGENSAPSVISYSGIGRMRGGRIHAVSTDAIPDYADISEQYSIPDGKDDSRLDFRISKKKGNVFKGDVFLKGDNGDVRPVGDTYMLGVSAPVVEHGGTVSLSVYHVAGGKAAKMTEAAVKEKGLTLLLRRDTGSTSALTGSWGTIGWTTLTTNSTDVHSVTFDLKKGDDTLDSISVSVGKPQTEVWRLMAVTELAETDYTIDKDKYKAAYEAVNGSGTAATDPTADAVFVKAGNISLEYRILYQKGDGEPKVFTTIADAQKTTGKTLKLTVAEFGTSDQILGQYTSQDGTAAATKLQKLCFTDSSPVAATVAYVKVSFLDPGGNQLDLREVRMKLGTNGAVEFNKQFLSYIYYGTSGGGGTQYANKRISTMEMNYSELTKTVKGHDGRLGQYETKIRETAEGLSTEVSKRETTDRNLGKLNESVSKISQSSDEISTRVTSLYTDGNLLTGGDVRGSRAKRYQAYDSPVTTHLKKGITYTVTARMWMEAKDDYPTQPKMDGHYMTLFVYTKDWKSAWSNSFTYTKAGTVVDSFSFTPESDLDVLVGIYEQISGSNPDPKEYGGVSVEWVRIDMGDRTGEKQITEWTPSAGDVEERNLIPDPNFEVASWATTEGASSRGTIGDVSFMSRYTDDYDDYGFRGVRMTRSGYTGKDNKSGGLIYFIPFRGEGDYTLQAFIKDLNGVTLEDAVYIEVHPLDVNQSRICYGFLIGMFRQTYETGYFRTSRTYHFGKTATNAASGKAQEIRWLEVRVFLTRKGDVVVSRISLSKCGHAVHWNADALGSENGRTLSTESYVDQRADSLEAGIKKGLQSVGFRMDGETWSVNTWGKQFAWYASETDAKAGNTSNAVMYVDTLTNTLHVKGYVEATGGKIGELELMSDGGVTFERSKDSSGKYIEKSRSVMSSRSITFYEQHSDGRFSIVDPVSWLIKIQSDADHPGKGLQSVKMEGYDSLFPGHSVELGDNTTPSNWAKMTGMGIGYSTNGRAIAKVFQSGTGGLAMVCVAYGTIKADGTFNAEDQTQMALDYNCTVERVTKIGNGWYECTLKQTPHGLFTVFVRARVSSGGDVMYATLGKISNYRFTVMTSDDSTRNNCDFEYFVVSFGGY